MYSYSATNFRTMNSSPNINQYSNYKFGYSASDEEVDYSSLIDYEYKLSIEEKNIKSLQNIVRDIEKKSNEDQFKFLLIYLPRCSGEYFGPYDKIFEECREVSIKLILTLIKVNNKYNSDVNWLVRTSVKPLLFSRLIREVCKQLKDLYYESFLVDISERLKSKVISDFKIYYNLLCGMRGHVIDPSFFKTEPGKLFRTQYCAYQEEDNQQCAFFNNLSEKAPDLYQEIRK